MKNCSGHLRHSVTRAFLHPAYVQVWTLPSFAHWAAWTSFPALILRDEEYFGIEYTAHQHLSFLSLGPCLPWWSHAPPSLDFRKISIYRQCSLILHQHPSLCQVPMGSVQATSIRNLACASQKTARDGWCWRAATSENRAGSACWGQVQTNGTCRTSMPLPSLPNSLQRSCKVPVCCPWFLRQSCQLVRE